MKKEADRDDEALRLALYRAMWTARRLDEMDRDLARRR